MECHTHNPQPTPTIHSQPAQSAANPKDNRGKTLATADAWV